MLWAGQQEKPLVLAHRPWSPSSGYLSAAVSDGGERRRFAPTTENHWLAMVEFLLPAVINWPEWEPLFTDAATWRPVVDRLWAREPALAAQTGVRAPEEVVAGYPGTCAVFIVNNAVVVKFYPPMVATDWARERAVYRLLEDRLAEAPQLLAAGIFRDRLDWPYLVTTFRPGVAWREVGATVPAAQRLAIGRTVGERLRLVHETPLAHVDVWPRRDQWRSFVHERLVAAPAALRLRLPLPESLLAATERLLRRTDWFAAPPRLLHADLTEDHVLVNRERESWCITGLIDWGDAEVGDPVYEWVALYFGFCRCDGALFRDVLRGYNPGMPLPSPEQLLAFTLLHRFGPNIIADVLPAATCRHLRGLDDLAAALFPDLDG